MSCLCWYALAFLNKAFVSKPFLCLQNEATPASLGKAVMKCGIKEGSLMSMLVMVFRFTGDASTVARKQSCIESSLNLK